MSAGGRLSLEQRPPVSDDRSAATWSTTMATRFIVLVGQHRPNLQTVAALIVVQSDGTRDQRQFDGSARRSHRSKVSVRGGGGLAVLLLFLEGRVTGAVGKIVSIAAPVCWHDARVRASPNNGLTSSFADHPPASAATIRAERGGEGG